MTSVDPAEGATDTKPKGAQVNTAAAAEKKADKSYLIPSGGNPPTSAQDPIEKYRMIIKDEDLDADQKAWLIDRADRRFQNRRRMAYISLFALLGSLVVILGGAVVDGIADTKIVAGLQGAANLLGSTNALLAAIVAAYYGSSALRPSS